MFLHEHINIITLLILHSNGICFNNKCSLLFVWKLPLVMAAQTSLFNLCSNIFFHYITVLYDLNLDSGVPAIF